MMLSGATWAQTANEALSTVSGKLFYVFHDCVLLDHPRERFAAMTTNDSEAAPEFIMLPRAVLLIKITRQPASNQAPQKRWSAMASGKAGVNAHSSSRGLRGTINRNDAVV